MLEIPEQRVLASAQLGVRLWEENHPCKSTRVSRCERLCSPQTQWNREDILKEFFLPLGPRDHKSVSCGQPSGIKSMNVKS